MSKLAYDLDEAAEASPFGKDYLKAAIARGELRAKRSSRNADGDGVGKYVIKKADLEAFIDGLADA